MSDVEFEVRKISTLPLRTPLLEADLIVIVGDGTLAMRLSDRLFEHGVFAQGIAFPTVARDRARVRAAPAL